MVVETVETTQAAVEEAEQAVESEFNPVVVEATRRLTRTLVQPLVQGLELFVAS